MVELVKPEDCGEIKYVFFDTGLEWDATLNHLVETEKKYGITIERRKAKVPIPTACKKYGVPFISKDVSDHLSRLQRHGFDWKDYPMEERTIKFPKCKSAIDWFFDNRGKSKSGKPLFSIKNYKGLRSFIQSYPPPIDLKFSEKCCKYAKKDVAKEFYEKFNPDLSIIGLRQAEGGRRGGRIKNCFSPSGEKDFAEYRPLWFFTNEDKKIYKEWRQIKYSDCYEKWGFSRTGCVGCPCASNCVQQLEIAQLYEPNKVKAAWSIFGLSYEYKQKYCEFKEKKNEKSDRTRV